MATRNLPPVSAELENLRTAYKHWLQLTNTEGVVYAPLLPSGDQGHKVRFATAGAKRSFESLRSVIRIGGADIHSPFGLAHMTLSAETREVRLVMVATKTPSR